VTDERFDFGFGTRRRPKGLDYDAAKDADFRFNESEYRTSNPPKADYSIELRSSEIAADIHTIQLGSNLLWWPYNAH